MHCAFTLSLAFFHFFFFFNDTATTEIYTLSLHDALPISLGGPSGWYGRAWRAGPLRPPGAESLAPRALVRQLDALARHGARPVSHHPHLPHRSVPDPFRQHGAHAARR